MTFKAVTCSRNFPVRVNLPISTRREIFTSLETVLFLFFSFLFLPSSSICGFVFFEFRTFFSSRTIRTQACPHRKQVLARDARGQVGEVLGAVVDSVSVAEAETHACSRGVAGGGGVGGWGDEVLDGGAHVVC